MCTVSIIVVDGARRIVCNRDESRTRPPASPPKWRAIENAPGRAIWPMDMEGGGTWIGASETGLSFCLLNLNVSSQARAAPGLKSRGLIIPSLLGAETPERAVARLERMALRTFAPFRLVAVGPGVGTQVAEVRWDRERLGVQWHAPGPLCFVSSGLGDHRAAPRLHLFEEMVFAGGPTAERQDEFHRHTWPDRPEISVMMARADARTVSITTLEVGPAGVRMDYEPVPASPAAVG